MLRLDSELERWVVAHRLGALDPLFRGLSAVGTFGAVWLGLAAVLALVRRDVRILVAVALADLVADLVASLLQVLVGRPRPPVETLVSRPHTYSFPSGHATTSFACATVIAGIVPRLRLPALVLAAAIAWSRVYVGVHYPLDVAAGAVLGALLGLAVLRGLRRLAAGRRRSRRVLPGG